MLQRIRNAKSGASTTPHANDDVDRIYGSQYVPEDFRLKSTARIRVSDAVIDTRAILGAQVDEEEATNRRGNAFIQKKVVCFIAGPDGKACGSYLFLKLRSDSALQPGQWLDPKTLVVAKMRQNGVLFNGDYLVEEGHDFGGETGFIKPTPITDDKVDESVLALAQ